MGVTGQGVYGGGGVTSQCMGGRVTSQNAYGGGGVTDQGMGRERLLIKVCWVTNQAHMEEMASIAKVQIGLTNQGM